MNNEEDIKLDNELQEGTSNLASRWIRLWASIIDAIILMLITIPILYFTGGVEQIRDGIEPTFLYSSLIGLAGLLGFYLINIKLLLTKGQTVGKKVLDIKIVDLNDNLPKKIHLFRRYFIYFIPTYIPVIGAWLSIIDLLFIFGKEKRCVHDLIGKTKVVDS